jgi:hypothetical protein
MLQNDYGYSHYQAQPQHHQHSGERPKLFATMNNGGGYQGPGMHDFQQLVHPNNMTPQHHHMQQQTPQHQQQTPQHQQNDFDHEPIMMNMQHAGQYYAPPPMTAQMLHVSTDYNSGGSVNGTTPSHSGTKRSREELNMKEKKRMFKLNDRINQLKDLLDEAGVQTKKNKQSILDNAAHYIEMLRSNLLIAKQKAERAEKQAEAFRAQAQKSSSGADKVVRGVFQKTTTPRVVVDMNMQTVTFNAAFVKHTGETEPALKKQKTLRPYLCADQDKLDSIMSKVRETKQSTSALVESSAAGGNAVAVNLVAAVMTDDSGKPTNVEFSLIPVETLAPQPQQQRAEKKAAPKLETEAPHDDAETSAEENSVTDGDVTESKEEESTLQL